MRVAIGDDGETPGWNFAGMRIFRGIHLRQVDPPGFRALEIIGKRGRHAFMTEDDPVQLEQLRAS